MVHESDSFNALQPLHCNAHFAQLVMGSQRSLRDKCLDAILLQIDKTKRQKSRKRNLSFNKVIQPRNVVSETTFDRLADDSNSCRPPGSNR
jgi:hypothetical protein